MSGGTSLVRSAKSKVPPNGSLYKTRPLGHGTAAVRRFAKHTSRLFSPVDTKTCNLNRDRRLWALSEKVDEAIENQTGTYNWFKQWWPVYVEGNLHTDRPNRIQLLGEYFVVWKKPGGEWVTMKDVCPHRMAPLSEGRIEDDGTLMCSYHGWRFNECGKCVKIPQADDEKSHQVACESPRSVAKTYPCKIGAGMLWIWPDDSANAFDESAITSLQIPEEYLKEIEERIGVVRFVSRTVPFSAETLMENLLDPAHVPFSHHGVLARREGASPLHMQFIEPEFQSSLSAVSYNTKLGGNKVSHDHAELCTLNSVIATTGKIDQEGWNSRLFFLSTPMDRQKSHLFGFAVLSKSLEEKKNKSPLVLKLFPWLGHLGFHTVLDGDNIFLRMQEDCIHSRFTEWRPSAYFMPSSADLLVNAYRIQLMKKGGGGPKMPGSGGEQVLSRYQLLDRYESHVAFCKICQNGLRFLNRVEKGCQLLCAFTMAATAFLVYQWQQRSLPLWKAFLPVIPCLLFGLIAIFINKKILPQFYFVDYVHQDKH